ncbi:DUF1738 domain-containing protein [Flavobacterium arcticum]|uniref:DUF1738 domain-containing protein n=1 Tax=Flavobacterium arcticum TaxID=1784713 RepID=A0A345H8M1_9FLAO|nr:zincin-like metallopeptidase domain-containing protein [Flavobacterium arcticum]AXG72931.1 DUF1738 domain-containing protein [Flavobacterium arcticum]KAF2510405.1 DUF1738 domain-containing protein [Flavobacterium arcticum]
MSAVDTFNGLNGATVSRAMVQELIAVAKEQEQYELVKRLTKALEHIAEGEEVDIELEHPAIEVVPESLLHCLDCEHDTDDTIEGLGKAVSPDQIYQMITDKMLKKIEDANSSDYVKRWEAEGYSLPFNFISKKRYRGVNLFLLTELQLLENPFFLTFKQIEQLKGKLKKGAKAEKVIYFTKLYTYKNNAVNISSYDAKKFIGLLEKNREKIPGLKTDISIEMISKYYLPILKYYNVFNGKDITGIDFDLDNFKTGFVKKSLPALEENRNNIAESIINNYPTPAPDFDFGGDRAYYRPDIDHVQIPFYKDFNTNSDYYRTVFHELAHSTGHDSRLARDLKNGFGTKEYAFEELIAEFSATFLSAEAGVLWHTNKNHAAYLKGWHGLIPHLEGDNRFLMRAATQAQKAADYILQPDEDGNPKYFEDLKKAVEAPKEPKPTKRPKKATPKPKTVKPTKEAPEKKTVAKRTRKSKVADTKQLTLALNGRKKQAARKAPVKKQSLNSPTPIAVKKQSPVSNNALVMSSEDLMNMEFESLKMDGVWSEFMQEPAKNMKIAIWGKPKNGKTSGAAQFANYLTKFGNVLYNFVDQGFNKSTQDIWRNSGMEDNPNAFATKADRLEDLEKLLQTGDYQFVFIDMINDYINKTGIKPHEFKERFINGFPEISFVLVFEVTKSGNFKGDQGWTHIVDAICTVEDFLMENRGRYGDGHFVVWEEGLKKHNPKKHEEIFANEPEPEPAQEVAAPQISFTVT